MKTLSAKELTEVCNKHGYGIGRYHKQLYYYTFCDDMGTVIEKGFQGNFHEFSKHMAKLCILTPVKE